MKRVLYLIIIFASNILMVNAEIEKVSDEKSLVNAINARHDIFVENSFYSTSEVTIPKDAKITLDLNGKTITCPQDRNAFLVWGKLTIKGEGKITRTNATKGYSLFSITGTEINPAELNIEGGYITFTSTKDDMCDIVRVGSNSTLNIRGGILSTTQSCYGTIYNNSGCVNVYGGVIKNTCNDSYVEYGCVIFNNSATATTNVLGGELRSSKSVVYHKNKGFVNVSNAAVLEGKIENCDNYIITDTAQLKIPQKFIAATVTYDRGASNAFGTACLPFTPVEGVGITYYKLGKMSGDGNVLMLEEVETPLPNVPYIYHTSNGTFSVKSAAGVNFTAGQKPGQNTNESGLSLRGVYERTSVFASSEDEDYLVCENAKIIDPNAYYISNGEFKLVSGYFNLKPFRAYISSSNTASNAFSIVLSDLATSSSVESDSVQPIEIYDLAGNSRQNLQKGINIVKLSNGKVQKIMVK